MYCHVRYVEYLLLVVRDSLLEVVHNGVSGEAYVVRAVDLDGANVALHDRLVVAHGLHEEQLESFLFDYSLVQQLPSLNRGVGGVKHHNLSVLLLQEGDCIAQALLAHGVADLKSLRIVRAEERMVVVAGALAAVVAQVHHLLLECNFTSAIIAVHTYAYTP